MQGARITITRAHLLPRKGTDVRVHCSQIVEMRCIAILTLEFSRVVQSDSLFTELDPQMLNDIIQCENLACSNESSLWHALVKWYDTSRISRDEQKKNWLIGMIRHVRWAFVSKEQGESILQDIQLLTMPDVREVVEQHLNFGNVSSSMIPRQNGGTLTGQNPDLAHDSFFPDAVSDSVELALDTMRKFTVGRSRQCDLHLHEAAPNYLSGTHFQIYFEIDYGNSTAPTTPHPQAMLLDLSSNGTYVNGQLVGRHNTHILQDLDRIDMCDPPNSGEVFPHFVYHGPPSRV